MGQRYVIVWQFDVAPGLEADFLRHYGPHGTWTDLFRRDPDYLDTILIHDRKRAGRYLTIDRWRSEGAWNDFQRRHAQAYQDLDRACERLTIGESLIGHYDELT